MQETAGKPFIGFPSKKSALGFIFVYRLCLEVNIEDGTISGNAEAP